MKRKRSHRLLYMPIGGSALKEYRLTSGRLILIAASIVLCIVIVVSALTTLTLTVIPNLKIKSLTVENEQLLAQINTAYDRVKSLEVEIESLAENDEHIRLMVDLPLINQETRLAGIGGALPAEGIDPGLDLHTFLDQLERQIEIQKKSYPEIVRKFEENIDLVAHTPAICPLNNPRITSRFGYRKDPFTGRIKPHKGLDFGARRGTSVTATADGVVVDAKRIPNFGKTIVIDHGFGYETVYGHLQTFKVRPGSKVKRGQIIGTVGNTGRSTAPHLHYEVRVNKEQVDPLDYMFEESLAKYFK